MDSPKGKIVIISSPSGGGKTSICRKLLSRVNRSNGWQFSISYTTRKPRTGERNGREYHFVNEQEFEKLVKEKKLAEHFKVHNSRYGTPRKPIEQAVKKGGVMLFDVDVQGAKKLHMEFPEAIAIFILPPSKSALRQRLQKRGTETEEQLKIRFNNAIKEMKTFKTYNFDYVVINKELKEAVRQVKAIIDAHQCRVDQIKMEQIKKITG